MHWAVTGKTAAEIITERVDADQPNLGLTNWRGATIIRRTKSIGPDRSRPTIRKQAISTAL